MSLKRELFLSKIKYHGSVENLVLSKTITLELFLLPHFLYIIITLMNNKNE